MENFARTASGSEFFYPLGEETFLDVAGALKEASYRSADAYLGELRLGHIEAKSAALRTQLPRHVRQARTPL